MFSTIQNLTHKVRTAYGDSPTSYGGFWDKYTCPPQGLGQGNGAGPAIWSIISSTVFFSLRTQGLGVQFTSPLTKQVFDLCGFAYVDDSDLIVTGESAVKVAHNMQNSLSAWEGLIKPTGGVMAPEKSWWYLIDFDWTNGKWSY